MAKVNLETTLQTLIAQCEAQGCPLSEVQQALLRQLLQPLFGGVAAVPGAETPTDPLTNPLDELTPEERQVFLQFIQAQEAQDQPWQATLLNDWLHNRPSGPVQFLRDRYGLPWLNRITADHVAAYGATGAADAPLLRVGDRIEVSNSLWEWVQADGPCTQEWFPCTITGLSETRDGGRTFTSCTVRFDNGAEYQIQGMFDWNRYHWRSPSS